MAGCTLSKIGTRRRLAEALAILRRPGAQCSLDDGPSGRDLRVDTDGMTW